MCVRSLHTFTHALCKTLTQCECSMPLEYSSLLTVLLLVINEKLNSQKMCLLKHTITLLGRRVASTAMVTRMTSNCGKTKNKVTKSTPTYIPSLETKTHAFLFSIIIRLLMQSDTNILLFNIAHQKNRNGPQPIFSRIMPLIMLGYQSTEFNCLGLM